MKNYFIVILEGCEPLFINAPNIKSIFLFLMKWHGYSKKILLKTFDNLNRLNDFVELFEEITDEHIIYIDTISKYRNNSYLNETHTWYVNIDEDGDDINE